MPDRIRAAVRHTGDVLPDDPAAITRCIMDSLAAGYAKAITTPNASPTAPWTSSSGRRRLPEPAALPAHRRRHRQTVVAGPVEATALGNILVQARAAGNVSGGLAELRRLVVASHGLQTFTPQQLSRL